MCTSRAYALKSSATLKSPTSFRRFPALVIGQPARRRTLPLPGTPKNSARRRGFIGVKEASPKVPLANDLFQGARVRGPGRHLGNDEPRDRARPLLLRTRQA